MELEPHLTSFLPFPKNHKKESKNHPSYHPTEIATDGICIIIFLFVCAHVFE